MIKIQHDAGKQSCAELLLRIRASKFGGRALTKAATVLLSGGIDSACCLKIMKDDGYEIFPVFINFGQPAANLELNSVSMLGRHFSSMPLSIDVKSPVKFGSGEIRARNAFLISTALTHTTAAGGLIVIGIHSGTPYYDCSPPFLSKISELTAECTDGRFGVVAPLLTWSKSEVYSYFRRSGIDARLTHSCELDVVGGCGACASCLDRGML